MVEQNNYLGQFYWYVLKNIVFNLVGYVWIKKVEGLENLPQGKSYVIVPNHASFIDFMVIMASLKQEKFFRFFIKEDYFDMGIWKHFLVSMTQIRADKWSIKRAVKSLHNGVPVVLFVEGTRTRSGEFGNIHPGLGAIGLLADISIVPMGIKGSFVVWPWNKKFPNFLKRKCIEIKVGKPLKVREFSSMTEFFDVVREKIKELAM